MKDAEAAALTGIPETLLITLAADLAGDWLGAAGVAGDRPLFVCAEGVLPYLQPEQAVGVFRAVAERPSRLRVLLRLRAGLRRKAPMAVGAERPIKQRTAGEGEAPKG